MSKQSMIKPLSIALGATFAATLAASNVAVAAPAGDNPFAMSDLGAGYMQVAENDKKEGKCGEGKCGEGKKADSKKKDGKCGEGKCGEGKCGADKKKDAKKKDGKCGEGKCGEGKK